MHHQCIFFIKFTHYFNTYQQMCKYDFTFYLILYYHLRLLEGSHPEEKASSLPSSLPTSLPLSSNSSVWSGYSANISYITSKASSGSHSVSGNIGKSSLDSSTLCHLLMDICIYIPDLGSMYCVTCP